MSEKRIQIATHFTIDPAKQTLGAIQFPETVTVTMVVGDEIIPKKVAFKDAFSHEQIMEIEIKVNALVKEALRTAKPVESKPASATATDDLTTAEETPATDSGSSFELF